MSWMLIALLACGPKTDPAPAPEPVPEPAPQPAPEPDPEPTGSLTGDWSSPSCGERTYPRELKLSEDGTWTARDLVSPCPPDVQCVWSGIVESHGTWTADGDAVTLTEETTDERARPRPTRLEPAEGGAMSVEPDGSCLYTRPETEK